MKKLFLFIPALVMVVSMGFSQPVQDGGFEAFAQKQDSLFNDAYQRKDIPGYTSLLGEFNNRYSALNKPDQKKFSNYYINASYNLCCTYALLGNKTAALEWLERSLKAGYKASWNNFLLVELRKKGDMKNISVAVIYWKQIKPVITAIYTSAELNNFLKILKRPWDRSINTPMLRGYATLEPGNSSLILYLSADIYKKEAIEYAILKQGSTDTIWKANDFDNNFIWLNGLSYGHYSLQIRYARQRHNVTNYHFEIKPYRYQATLFKISIAILIAAFLGFIFLSFRFRAQQQKLREAELKKEKTATELKAIRSQLNPHFVFNALGSIQGLINTNEIDAANKYLSDFASLMRDTLTGTNKTGNSIFHEMGMLKNYLELEQLRFHFNFSIKADPGIDVSAIEIPSLLLQPLAENAVKHGVSALGEKGTILVEIKKENADINVLIKDNGPGFSAGENISGFGLKLTKDRIKLLNQLSKDQHISLNMESDAERGTTVYLFFKNWLL